MKSDSEIIETYEQLLEIFGKALPNPEHYPKQFEYYFRMYQRDQKKKEAAKLLREI
jgi:hypothetical protein